MAQDQTCRHHREDPRRAQRLGGQKGQEGDREGHRGVHLGSESAHAKEGGYPGDGRPDGDTTDHGPGEIEQNSPAGHLIGRRRDEPVTTTQPGNRQARSQRDQSSGVVQQRLALQDRDDAPGQADLAGHCSGRDCIWRGHDRPECEGQAKGDRQHRVGYDGHA